MITKFYQTANAFEIALAKECSEDFSRWASIGHDPDGDDSLNHVQRMQIKLMRWERRNFGLQPSWTSLCGVFEEFGELEEAPNREETLDAVGDILIFSSNLLVKFRLGIWPMLTAPPPPRLGVFAVDVGWASHVALKTEQKVRGYDDPSVARRDMAIAVYRLISRLHVHAEFLGTTAEEAYLMVGTNVIKRDWRANPSGIGM